MPYPTFDVPPDRAILDYGYHIIVICLTKLNFEDNFFDPVVFIAASGVETVSLEI
jgi:hypothetical protein